MADLVSADLAAFLLARCDDEEAAARLATPGPWEWSDDGLELCGTAASGPRWVLSASYDDSIVEATPEDKAHIARWDPARVLAECEARRRIVEMHQPEQCWSVDVPMECGQCSFHEAHEGFNDEHEPWPCLTLRMLALPFVDHPDFDPSWRP